MGVEAETVGLEAEGDARTEVGVVLAPGDEAEEVA